MTNLDYVTEYVGDPDAAQQLDEMLSGISDLNRAFPQYNRYNHLPQPATETVEVSTEIIKQILTAYNKLID